MRVFKIITIFLLTIFITGSSLSQNNNTERKGQRTPYLITSTSKSEINYETFLVLSPYGSNSLDHYITTGIIDKLQIHYKAYHPETFIRVITLYLNNSIINIGTNPECVENIKKYKPNAIFITQGLLVENLYKTLKDYPIFFVNFNPDFPPKNNYSVPKYIIPIMNSLADSYVDYRIDLSKLRLLMNILGIKINNFYIMRNVKRRNSLNISKAYQRGVESAFPSSNIEMFECNTTLDLRKHMRTINDKPKGVIILAFRSILNEEQLYLTELDMLSEYLSYNKKHFELGFYELSTRGLLFSCSPSLYDIGQGVANLYLLKFHEKHTEKINMIGNILTMNYSRMKRLNIFRTDANIFTYIDELH